MKFLKIFFVLFLLGLLIFPPTEQELIKMVTGAVVILLWAFIFKIVGIIK